MVSHAGLPSSCAQRLTQRSNSILSCCVAHSGGGGTSHH